MIPLETATPSLSLSELLGSEGLFASELPGFVSRAAQLAMAEAVREAIERREDLIVEAGTGTGKTYAYLIPALLTDKRVIISTGTRALQDQLFFRDLPRVRSVLGRRRRVALLKGRANYLCRYRLEQYQQQGTVLDPATAAALAAVRAWATRSRQGDRTELAEVSEDAPIWPRITSTVDNCLGQDCPLYEDCYVIKARREALNADLVVVNHHVLFADLVLKRAGFAELLPAAGAFIVDEAHQLPELAGRFFAESLSSHQLTQLVRDACQEAQSQPGALHLLLEPCESLITRLKELRLLWQNLPPRGALGEALARPGLVDGLQRLDDLLADFTAVLASQAERSRGLAHVHTRAQALSARLESLLGNSSESAASGTVRWYEYQAQHFNLSATPLSLAKPLQELRGSLPAAWIHTSATLSAAGDFSHFKTQMGLSRIRALELPSPFDYARQALCYLPSGLPSPAAGDYTERVIAAVLPVLEASQGRAFLLFTSHRALRRAEQLLNDQLPWPLFVQGRAPRHQLLEAFRASGHGVLLGAASFWEGVDVAGEALSLVVIDKLPFAAPDDPVLSAQLERLSQTGQDAFLDWQLPAAAIALKQGAGRLIRGIHDRGVLMLCDPRLSRKGYGKRLLRSLPAMPRTDDLAQVQAFFICSR